MTPFKHTLLVYQKPHVLFTYKDFSVDSWYTGNTMMESGIFMQRYKVILSYDGTQYVGFQVQKNGNSIQAELNKALKKMTKGTHINVCGSGRTDSGVHANGQVVHFDYPVSISPASLKRALNSLLPDDIYVKSATPVSQEFHARYSAVGKRYHYRVDLSDAPQPFKRLYTLHHPYRIDVEAMNRSLQAIIGTHDFTSFCSIKSDKEDKVRTVTKADVFYHEAENELLFTFEGNGFLYNMVRILVGTALQVGDGLKPEDSFQTALLQKDRSYAGPTAAAQGLYLDAVFYDS